MEWYFDEWERKKLFKKRESDPYNSLLQCVDYTKKYNKDYMGYLTYAGFLIDLNMLDEAKRILDLINPNSKLYKQYYNRVTDEEIEPMKHVTELIRFYIYTGEYEKAYLLCEKNLTKLLKKIKHIYAVEVFLQDKLGLNDSIINSGYLTSQIVDYSEERFLKHIKDHLEDTREVYYKHKSIFSSNFNVKEVIDEVKKHIPNERRVFINSFIQDHYTFKYDNCGRMDNTIADYFRVVTLHDSSNFVTMFPVSYGENYPYVDLNYLKDDMPRVKKVSQIEKFNKKYGL